MEKNVGSNEAVMRTVAAVVVILLALIIDNPYVKILFALVAAVLAGTAFLRTCLIYKYMGKNTCDTEKVEDTPPADEPRPEKESDTPSESDNTETSETPEESHEKST